MAKNVIILGAGSSRAAGVPLLADFVDRMLRLAASGKRGASNIPQATIDILRDAASARESLNSYHGRAAFDDRNIEDILSILSFGTVAGISGDSKKLKQFIRAIAKTIELECKIRHDGRLDRITTCDIPTYTAFWRVLFEEYQRSGSPPAIITFNYDLVLERALLCNLIGEQWDSYNRAPFEGVNVRYFHERYHSHAFQMSYTTWRKGHDLIGGCTVSDVSDPHAAKNWFQVDFLKLHGSLNFPTEGKPGHSSATFVTPCETPHLLPPIFNKLNGTNSRQVWRSALQHLREAVNIFVCGYSLPLTDTYMQYFFKAALGPNTHLSNIYVFDPVLYSNGTNKDQMIERYKTVFSEQIRKRIVFRPQNTNDGGTFEHFVSFMLNEGANLFD